jgi:hypothetical protein
MTTARPWPRNALDAQLVANAAQALYTRDGRWPSDKVGRTVRRLATNSYVTMKSSDQTSSRRRPLAPRGQRNRPRNPRQPTAA